jgi:hypothetical protein
MTRPGATIHALPVGAKGDHYPYASCPCRPIEAVDMADGPLGRLIVVHRHAPGHPRDPEPATCDCSPCLEWNRAFDAHRVARTSASADRLRLASERLDARHGLDRRARP